jgi:Flp pilus assembly protein TadG
VKKRSLRTFLMDDSGSAVVEFVILALPLMIPLVMYLSAINSNSKINSDLHNLARQSARAFITSPSEDFEEARLQSVLQVFESRVLKPDGITEEPLLTVDCSSSPCLTPDSRVKVTASLTYLNNSPSGIFRFISTPLNQYSASDIQIVDAWR